MKILLLSDSALNVDKGGFPQTLYNVFSFLTPGELLFITSLQSYRIAPTSKPFDTRTITYNIEIIPVQKNRFGSYINRFIYWFNNSFFSLFKSLNELKTAIKNFDPDIVIVAPNSAEGMIAYNKLKPVLENRKVIPYFMDDWLYQVNLKWIGGNIHQLTRSIFQQNNAWMMISKRLAYIFTERYKLLPAEVLEIHNPVDLKDVAFSLPGYDKGECTIAYAGALWPMHFDAFLIMAKAIKLLQQKRKISLVLYTAESNWIWRREELKELNITYGGFIPYSNIHKKLAQADCLLAASSFTKTWETHSRGSVQTKLTDYMKASRLIISYGPSYSANNEFIKNYNCGICIETQNVEEAAAALNNILDNMQLNKQYIINGIEALKANFSFEKVHEGLVNFLQHNYESCTKN